MIIIILDLVINHKGFPPKVFLLKTSLQLFRLQSQKVTQEQELLSL